MSDQEHNLAPKFSGHPEFYRLLTQMAQLHSAKNHDYTDGKDPFLNFRKCETMGIPAWKGALVRAGDKFSRAENFAKRETLLVSDESFVDTMLDLAVYSLIIIILYQEARSAECQTTHASPSTPSSQSSQSEDSGSNTSQTDPNILLQAQKAALGSVALPTTSAAAGPDRGPQSWR